MLPSLGTGEIGLIVVALLARLLPFVLFAAGGYYLLRRSAIGRAMVERLHREHDEVPPAVERELDRLRGEILEIQERLDFTERALAQSRMAGEIPFDAGPAIPTPQ